MGFAPQPYFIAIPIEEWRWITYPGVVPGKYQISNYGNVFNMGYNRFVSRSINTYGYYTCALTTPDKPRNTYLYYVHRLVAWEWVLKNRDYNLQVNHIDGNKLNNSHMNLEWVTPIENVHHALAHGIGGARKGIHTNHKLTEEDVHMICKMLEDPKIKYDEIIEKLDGKITKTAIKQIAGKTRWEHISSQYDMKPRIRSGEHSRTKLTDTDVHCICTMLQNPDISYEYIHQLFKDKIGIDGIKHIAQRHVWTNVSDMYNIPPRSTKAKFSNYKNGNHRSLEEEDVHQICKMLQDPTNSYGYIASEMGGKVTSSAISKIADGTNWKEISKQYEFPNRNRRSK